MLKIDCKCLSQKRDAFKSLITEPVFIGLSWNFGHLFVPHAFIFKPKIKFIRLLIFFNGAMSRFYVTKRDAYSYFNNLFIINPNNVIFYTGILIDSYKLCTNFDNSTLYHLSVIAF